MNRKEALRILGLDEDATAADIKAAYHETAQILHPDRFAGNSKLEQRATEQFKNLQEAYECLQKSKGSRDGSGARASSARSSQSAEAADIEARLAGISAARTQLVSQRDLVLDERRNGAIMAGVGAVAVLLCRRPGVFAIIASIGAVAALTGIVQVVSAQRTINTLNEHLDELAKERKRLAALLDDL